MALHVHLNIAARAIEALYETGDSGNDWVRPHSPDDSPQDAMPRQGAPGHSGAWPGDHSRNQRHGARLGDHSRKQRAQHKADAEAGRSPSGTRLSSFTDSHGHRVTVNAEHMENFKGFVKDLEGEGYNIRSIGGYNYRRNRNNPSVWSEHAFGNAIDINPDTNPNSTTFQTDMPSNIRDIAHKHGLKWGGDFHGHKDTMHFEYNSEIDRSQGTDRPPQATHAPQNAAPSGRANENFTRENADALRESAKRIGTTPEDLATVIDYESAGSFSPNKWGGRGGNYMGLIQFGPNERATYGVHEGQTFKEQLGSVEGYLKDRGFKPGMGIKDLYSTINAGSPGHYSASDRPGETVDSHVERMVNSNAGHARRFLNSGIADDPLYSGVAFEGK